MKTIRERLEPLVSRINEGKDWRHGQCRQCDKTLYAGDTAWFDAVQDVFCSA